MVINDITVCGFDKIHQGLLTASENGYPEFCNKLDQFISHSMISIFVEDVTSLEMLYLRKFSSSVKVLNTSYGNFLKQDKEHIKVFDDINHILKLHDIIVKDPDINHKESNPDGMLPIGCIKYAAMVVFKGVAITSILGVRMSRLFSNDHGKMTPTYPGNSFVENFVVDNFPGEFYKFMLNDLRTVDVTSDYMINLKYYQYADTTVQLGNVNTYSGELNFFGATPDSIAKQTKELRSRYAKHPNVDKENIILDFVFNTSFATFMKMYLNSNFIISHESLEIVAGSENLSMSEDITAKYGQRIIENINDIIDYKNNLVLFNKQRNQFDFNVMNFIINGVKIKYCVQIPLSKKDELLAVCDIVDELKEVKSDIEKYTLLVEKLVL